MKRTTLALTAVIAVIAAAGTLAAAPASPLGPPPPSGSRLAKGQCIILRDAGQHRVVDQNTLLMGADGPNGGVYRFTMTNGCLRSAVSADPIGIRQVSNGGVICKASDVSLQGRSGFCAIDSIVKLTEAEVKALPRGLNP